MPSMRKSASLLLAAAASTAWAQALTEAQVMALGNNTLFTRWRPYSHFLAPHGWMNDPCGALFDPTRNVYHMHYQWHPNHINWGNISWGHAISTDMVTWTDVDHNPNNNLAAWQGQEAQSIGTTNLTSDHHVPAMYNRLGIFSGTAQPVNLNGEVDGTLLAFYTSVSRLPTSWRLPYLNGTESQSFALSTDGGITWEHYADNPVIGGPPAGWNITGWRDPFFLEWPEMDAFLGQTEPHYYTVFGSGIKGVGPRIPFYSAPASDLTDWTFLGALWEPAANTSLGSVLETGTYGFNFEVSGFFSLKDDAGNDHWIVNMGSEGGNVSFHQNNHWSLWNEGRLSERANGSVAFNPISGGAGDWGNLYALTSFNDTKNNRRVQYGWAPEDILGSFALTQQGFQGALSLPRELFILQTPNVANADTTQLGNSYYIAGDDDGSFTASTLGVRPLDDVVRGLRRTACYKNYNCNNLTLSTSAVLSGTMSASSEIDVTLLSTTGIAGITIGASPDRQEYTTIFFNPSNNTINVDRTYSSLLNENFVTETVVGYFEPYSIVGAGGVAAQEPINMRVFVDGSLVEVYVNERFALTTRIYPARQDSTGLGLFVGAGVTATYGTVQVWDGLVNVWPERPLNSSSVLVFDSPVETNNYTWWPGN